LEALDELTELRTAASPVGFGTNGAFVEEGEWVCELGKYEIVGKGRAAIRSVLLLSQYGASDCKDGEQTGDENHWYRRSDVKRVRSWPIDSKGLGVYMSSPSLDLCLNLGSHLRGRRHETLVTKHFVPSPRTRI
jgi:hypothetical protein